MKIRTHPLVRDLVARILRDEEPIEVSVTDEYWWDGSWHMSVLVDSGEPAREYFIKGHWTGEDAFVDSVVCESCDLIFAGDDADTLNRWCDDLLCRDRIAY